jgi:hypothetical protein
MLVRSCQGVPGGTQIRYRSTGGCWYAGETVEIRESELTLLCDQPLEVGVEVELLLPSKVQGKGREWPLRLQCAGRVVRRVLANWPELRCLLVVSLSHGRIQFQPGGGDSDAA